MNERIGGLVVLAACLLLAGLGAPGEAIADAGSATSPAPAGLDDAEAPAWSSAVGGSDYFYCALGQTLKVVGLILGNVPLVLAGAVGGGIACGLGI